MKTLTTLLCLTTLMVAADARGQQPTHLTLPTDGHWDVTGQLSMLNRHKTELTPWGNWYTVAAVNGSIGRYWTPHFKTEFEISTAGQGSIDGNENTLLPGSTLPYPRFREHRLRETTLGATAFYQFFENQWVHPFVGAGVEIVHERHLADPLPEETIRFSTTVPGLKLPPLSAIDTVTYSVRPVVAGGVKFYVSPHAFVRTDVRSGFSTERPVAWQWRAGIGFDF